MEQGGRYFVGTSLVNGEPLNAASLKQIPMGRIEALLNQPGVGAGICSPEATEITAERMAGVLAAQGDTRPLASWSAEFGAIEEALASLLSEPAPEVPQEDPAPKRQPLTRPTGTDPEKFYRRVAEEYSVLVGGTSRPAKVLADEANVPVATVHRWIHEARRRGTAAPSAQGSRRLTGKRRESDGQPDQEDRAE